MAGKMPSGIVEDVPQNGQLLGPIYAVKDISLVIKQGEIYGLLGGPKGSGKTTLIWLILGLLTPTARRFRLFDEVMPNMRVLNQVGYMTQASGLYEELTIRENINFFTRIYGRFDTKWIEEILQWVDLTERTGSSVRTLSGGMHVSLPPERAREAVSKGWAEPHPLAQYLGNEGMVMLYTPLDMGELEVVFGLILDSYNFVTGRSLQSKEVLSVANIGEK